MTTNGMRRLRYGKFGPKEDPTHAQVLASDGRLYDVAGMYYREFPSGAYMLTLRHFNGEPGPDVCATSVWILDRDWTPAN